ncbi:MAG: SpoVA/SpoVAEb family sporulation membrane protein [Defluviitaleaceae bacterium]|nr:SpoVA/SpoVAEb family sporulation membrane protein [Defluviitaleaceae bacterium]
MKTNQYTRVIKKHEAKPSYFKNMATAFFFGGLVCLIGQSFLWLYVHLFNVAEETAPTYMLVTLILIASVLTGLGLYDQFGQVSKAGGFVLITGFANSLTASALEGKSEGIVQGIATQMFKLAGAVIVFAVLSGFFFGLLRYFLVQLGIAPALDHQTVTFLMEVVR